MEKGSSRPASRADRVIDDLVRDLKQDEGWRPFAYRDSLGFLTIGFGFLIDQRRGGELPLPIADLWLHRLATERVNHLIARLPWLNEQPEDVRRALGNMAYQLGVDGVCLFRNMLAALKDGRRDEAAYHALDSRWAKQTPRRAHRVASLIRGN